MYLAVGITLVLSGCTSAGAKTSTPTSSAPAPPPTVTANTGSIAGTVTNTEMLPVQGADVGLQSAGATKTDTSGRFTFNDLQPGEYVVIAQRLGYESISKRTSVSVGQIASVNFTLVSMVVSTDAFSGMQILNGFYEYGFATPAVVLRPVNEGKDFFITNVTDGKNVKTLIDTMTWDSSAPLTSKYFDLLIIPDGNKLGEKNGKSPLTVRGDDAKLKKTSKIEHRTWCWPGSTSDPASLVAVVVQQKFTIYASTFWNKDAPENYTGLPA
jgi:hypothetical protein